MNNHRLKAGSVGHTAVIPSPLAGEGQGEGRGFKILRAPSSMPSPSKGRRLHKVHVHGQPRDYLITHTDKYKFIILKRQNYQVMKPREFLQRHKIFRIEDFDAATGLHGGNRQASLAYHRKRGHLLPIRRGLYWVVPAGSNPDTCSVDSFLVAAHAGTNAVIAFHSALELHGRAYSDFGEVQFLARSTIRPFDFRGVRYRPLKTPPALARAGKENLGVEALDRAGEGLRVTTLERCLVDALDRPGLCGGWEEVWRSLDTIEYLDLDAVCRYVVALDNATTAAKAGWYLQENRERLMADDTTLETLRALRPASPHYINQRRREPTRFLSGWNLVVPLWLAERNWEEPA